MTAFSLQLGLRSEISVTLITMSTAKLWCQQVRGDSGLERCEGDTINCLNTTGLDEVLVITKSQLELEKEAAAAAAAAPASPARPSTPSQQKKQAAAAEHIKRFAPAAPKSQVHTGV